MPELPEVETIRTELESKIIDQKIDKINVHWHKTFENHCDTLPHGKKIVTADRIGKYIIFNLDHSYLVVHLRMTGQLIFTNSDSFSNKHLRASIRFSSGAYLNFYDARKFGRIYHIIDLDNFFANTGIDALNPDFTADSFKQMLVRKKQGIKSFLLNQKYIAGLGNIYIDESLFLSGIHPQKLTGNIPNNHAENLYNNIKRVLNSAIENMGTTISDYRTIGGGFGSNQNFLKVYGRENETCFQCDSKIKKIRINSRGTHFCPVCQPENGALK